MNNYISFSEYNYEFVNYNISFISMNYNIYKYIMFNVIHTRNSMTRIYIPTTLLSKNDCIEIRLKDLHLH